jgi:hypothetical protein
MRPESALPLRLWSAVCYSAWIPHRAAKFLTPPWCSCPAPTERDRGHTRVSGLTEEARLCIPPNGRSGRVRRRFAGARKRIPGRPAARTSDQSCSRAAPTPEFDTRWLGADPIWLLCPTPRGTHSAPYWRRRTPDEASLVSPFIYNYPDAGLQFRVFADLAGQGLIPAQRSKRPGCPVGKPLTVVGNGAVHAGDGNPPCRLFRRAILRVS